MKSKLGRGLALLLVAAIAGGWWWSQRGVEADAGYKTARLERGPLLAAVSSSGTVNPVRQVVIGSQVSGQIKEMLVDFNSEVTQGQVIARIDPQVFTYRVNQAMADLESTRAAVLNAQANVGAATAAVSRARLDADNAQRDRLRKQELLERQFVSQADFENSRNIAGTLAEALKVSLAQLEVARAQVVSAQAVVRQREAALSQARFDLERTEIRSPVDGVVIKRSVDVGQTVAASLQAPELFIIARDLSDMQVEAAIDEADIARVRIDQKVTFTIDAFAGRSFEGRVGQIRKAAVSAQNVVTYTVVVAFANPNAAVLPGMTANVRIVTEVRDNVLKVPNAALRVRLPGIEPVDLAASAASAASASEPRAEARRPADPGDADQKPRPRPEGGARSGARGRIHILGPDGKPHAFFVRLGVSDGLSTELLIGAGTARQSDADLIKEGAEVVISAGKPVGAPPGAARTGPSAAPRAPF